MRAWLTRFDRFWFEPAPAERLAALRILTGGYMFWLVFVRYEAFLVIFRSDPGFFHPVGVATVLSGPLDVALADAIFWATLFFNVCFLLGIKHRVTGPLYAALLLFVLSYRQSWSMVYHSMNLPLLHIMVLAVSPSANAYSLDAFLRSRSSSRLANYGSWPPTESREDGSYGWPVRLICAVTLLTYFVAGIAKVAGPLGWGWAYGTALRDQIAVDALRKEFLSTGGSSWAFTLYEHTYLLTLFSVGTLVVELGAPFVIVHARTAQVWALATFAMHYGIYVVMGIQFRYQMCGVAFASFFPIERVSKGLGVVAKGALRALTVGKRSG